MRWTSRRRRGILGSPRASEFQFLRESAAMDGWVTPKAQVVAQLGLCSPRWHRRRRFREGDQRAIWCRSLGPSHRARGRHIRRQVSLYPGRFCKRDAQQPDLASWSKDLHSQRFSIEKHLRSKSWCAVRWRVSASQLRSHYVCTTY